jgi:hypothetical protein
VVVEDENVAAECNSSFRCRRNGARLEMLCNLLHVAETEATSRGEVRPAETTMDKTWREKVGNGRRELEGKVHERVFVMVYTM